MARYKVVIEVIIETNSDEWSCEIFDKMGVALKVGVADEAAV